MLAYASIRDILLGTLFARRKSQITFFDILERAYIQNDILARVHNFQTCPRKLAQRQKSFALRPPSGTEFQGGSRCDNQTMCNSILSSTHKYTCYSFGLETGAGGWGFGKVVVGSSEDGKNCVKSN